jgi:hypothetical protein
MGSTSIKLAEDEIVANSPHIWDILLFYKTKNNKNKEKGLAFSSKM